MNDSYWPEVVRISPPPHPLASLAKIQGGEGSMSIPVESALFLLPSLYNLELQKPLSLCCLRFGFCPMPGLSAPSPKLYPAVESKYKLLGTGLYRTIDKLLGSRMDSR